MSVRYYKKYSIVFGSSLFTLNNNIFSKCCKSNGEKIKNIEKIRESEIIEIKDKDNVIEKNIDDNIDKNKDKIDVKEDVNKEKKVNEKNNNNEIDKDMTLYDINKFYIVFKNNNLKDDEIKILKDNNLKDDEIKILVDHYKYKNELLNVEQYKSLLSLLNEEFDNGKLLELIKLKLNYNAINDNNEKFNDTVTYGNERITYEINGNEYVCTGNKKKENINNTKYVDSLHQILLDITRVGNLVSSYIFENNENLDIFNNFIVKKREEGKFKKALTKVLVNSVLNYNLEYYQGMNFFAEFFLLLTAKKDEKDKYSVTYNEKEALELFNLFLNMRFDKIIIESYINRTEFQVKDFYNKELIAKLLPTINNLINIISNNLEINLQKDRESVIGKDDKSNKVISSLTGILHDFNISKVKTYNDLKKMFLLLFLTHNYNVIFDIFAISTLKFLTSKNVNGEFLIDLSLD